MKCPKRDLEHMKTKFVKRFLAGLFLITPFVVVLYIARLLFKIISHLIEPLAKSLILSLNKLSFINNIPEFYIKLSIGLFSLVILLVLIYLLGWLGEFIFIKRFIGWIDGFLYKIPLLGNVYKATVQVIKSISKSGRTRYKSIILVEFPRQGYRSIGFLTGYLTDKEDRKFCKVLIPTTPNPPTGFLQIIPKELVEQTSLSIEEAFKTIIFGGLASDEILKTTVQ